MLSRATGAEGKDRSENRDPDHLRDRRARLLKIRTLHRFFGKPTTYDISDVCNLTCEGCLYFSGKDYVPRPDSSSLLAWDMFFEGEKQRGVNFGYFTGAEPSLAPDILRQAMKHIPAGVIFSNGIKKVPDDVRYSIHFSIWGDAENNAQLRGADNTAKALRNYQGDERAMATLTINRRNIDQIVPITRRCADHGVNITYSYFSPTDDYLDRLSGAEREESDYYRVSSGSDNIMLGPDDFERARNAILEAKQAYPENVLYLMGFNDWVTGPDLYDLDENGIATDCGIRLSPELKHWNVDLTENSGKCCSPNIDCKDCRAYANTYGTYLARLKSFAGEGDKLDQWIEVWELWARMFILREAQDRVLGNVGGEKKNPAYGPDSLVPAE